MTERGSNLSDYKGRKNSELRKYPFAALFDGQISDLFTKEKIENRQQQPNKTGNLERLVV